MILWAINFFIFHYVVLLDCTVDSFLFHVLHAQLLEQEYFPNIALFLKV